MLINSGTKPDAHRAEKRRRVGRRIVEEHQDAIAAPPPQRLETMAPLRSLGAQFGIAARAGRTDQRLPVAAAKREILEQDTAGIVALEES